MSLVLVPILEVDMADITMCLGNFYLGLLGWDLLCWHNKTLGMATITLLGLD